MVLRLARGLDGGLHDVARGREVGFSGAEADDRPASCLQRLRLRIDGQSGGFGNSGNALGDAGSRHGRVRSSLAAGRLDVGFDEIYSMLFTGSPAAPNGNVTDGCQLFFAGPRGPERAGSTSAQLCVDWFSGVENTMMDCASGKPAGRMGRSNFAPKGSGAIGSAAVSKTAGCRFESCLPCACCSGSSGTSAATMVQFRAGYPIIARMSEDQVTETAAAAPKATPPRSRQVRLLREHRPLHPAGHRRTEEGRHPDPQGAVQLHGRGARVRHHHDGDRVLDQIFGCARWVFGGSGPTDPQANGPQTA